MRLDLQDDEVASLGAGGFILRDAVLGEARAQAIAAAAAALPGYRAAGVSRAGLREPAIRGDELVWLDDDAPPPLSDLIHGFAAVGRELDAAAYLGLGRVDIQIARYPGGGARYERHRDAFRGPVPDGGSRVVTAIYYLNAGWRPEDGGVLRLHLAGGPVDVEPRLDRLAIFLSALVEHEVLPAHTPRLAATGWFYRRSALPGLPSGP